MTTVWPIIVLGLVATTVLLLPAFLKGRWFLRSDTAARQEQILNRVEPHTTDGAIGNPLNWSFLFVCALLPLTVLLLLLWGVAARELSDNSWWIPLVIIFPVGIGMMTAWNQQRRGDERDTGG